MRSNNSLTERDVLLLALASDFQVFFERVFADVEPRVKLVDSEFIAVMVDRLKQVLSGSSRRLVVNLPPRHLKSLLISVAFVAFALGRDPRKQIAVISHSQSLAADLAGKAKRVMESQWYRSVFPKTRLVRSSVSDSRRVRADADTRHHLIQASLGEDSISLLWTTQSPRTTRCRWWSGEKMSKCLTR